MQSVQLPFKIGRYECQQLLGGTIAEIYRGFDQSSDRQVVVKVLGAQDASDPELCARFLNEGRLSSTCSHPNIVAAFDVGQEAGQPYLVTEYVPGESLRVHIHRGLTKADAIRLGVQIASAIQFVHSQGIIHRDLKPDSFRVTPDGTVKLIDFGMATLIDSSTIRAGPVIRMATYTAPEQVQALPISKATDMYAFGMLLLEMLTRASPYPVCKTRAEMESAILKVKPELSSLEKAGVSKTIIALIGSCLQKDPIDRPESFAFIWERLKSANAADSAADDVFATGVPSVPQGAAPARASQPKPSPLPQRVEETDRGGVVLTNEMPKPPLKPPDPRPVSRPRLRPVWLATIAGCVVVLGAVVAYTYWPSNELSSILKLPSGDMVLVLGGPAQLGAHRETVNVDTFYIDKTEVCNRAYLHFCDAMGQARPVGISVEDLDLPVVNVTFDEAKAFTRWAQKRLPTAQEWEKAARGDKGQAFPWGNEMRSNLARVPESLDGMRAAHDAKPSSANSYPQGASPYGALNMVGNVWEWVDARRSFGSEEEFAKFQRIFSELVPPLSQSDLFYQIRGGSYKFYPPAGHYAALIYDASPFPARARRPDVGFRCARDATP